MTKRSNEFLGSLMDATEKITDKIKSPTRAALEEVKKDIETHGSQINPEKAVDWVRKQSGLSPEKWAKEEAGVRLEIQNALLEQTNEFRQMDQFAKAGVRSSAEKIAKSKDPKKAAKNIQEKVKKEMDKLPGGSSFWQSAVAALTTWFGKDSGLGKFLTNLFSLNKKEKTKTAKAKQPSKAPKTSPEKTSREKELIAQFKEKKWILDEKTLANDLKTLAKEGYSGKRLKNLITLATEPNGNLTKILEAIGDRTFKVRLLDVKLVQRNDMDINVILAALKKTGGEEHSVKKTPEGIREFLNAVVETDTTNPLSIALKKFKKGTATA